MLDPCSSTLVPGFPCLLHSLPIFSMATFPTAFPTEYRPCHHSMMPAAVGFMTVLTPLLSLQLYSEP